MKPTEAIGQLLAMPDVSLAFLGAALILGLVPPNVVAYLHARRTNRPRRWYGNPLAIFSYSKGELAVVGASVAMFFMLAHVALWTDARIPRSPELALQAFHEREVAEDQIMDPLILAGPAVVPLLLADIGDPEMPRRRYAIGALGNLGDPAALPALARIAASPTELDYFRCDALTAVWMIDQERAKQLAVDLGGAGLSCLNDGLDDPQRDYPAWLALNAPTRTWRQALIGRHD